MCANGRKVFHMIDYPWNYVFIIFVVISSYINKFFFLKDGIILKIEGFLIKKIGNRTEDSKWGKIYNDFSLVGVIIFLIDLFIHFLHQQADKIQQQIGNLP